MFSESDMDWRGDCQQSVPAFVNTGDGKQNSVVMSREEEAKQKKKDRQTGRQARKSGVSSQQEYAGGYPRVLP